jgi:hypothetical protein
LSGTAAAPRHGNSSASSSRTAIQCWLSTYANFGMPL